MIVRATDACMDVSRTDAEGTCNTHTGKTCSGPDCTRPVGEHGARGLCDSHYHQLHRGTELRPLREDPWERLARTARRFVSAEQNGWSEQGLKNAMDRLKEAAIDYRRKNRGKRRVTA